MGAGRETSQQVITQGELEECREQALGAQRMGMKYSSGPTLCQNFLEAFMYDASE